METETALWVIVSVLLLWGIGAIGRRWREKRDLRERELRLREDELALRERELALKEREEKRNHPPPFKRLAPIITDERVAKILRERDGGSSGSTA
jgi:hypothetical protein